MPEERYIAWTSTNAFTEDEITGVWAIEASLPSDEWDCGPDCGGLFTFHGNGEGEVTREFIDQSGQLSEDTTQFGWVLNEAGNVELSITDVDGVTEISRHRVYDDKLAALQVRTTVTDASAGETVVQRKPRTCHQARCGLGEHPCRHLGTLRRPVTQRFSIKHRRS